MLDVEKFPWANTLDVARGVEMRSPRYDAAGRSARIEMDSTIFRPWNFRRLLDNLGSALNSRVLLVMLRFARRLSLSGVPP